MKNKRIARAYDAHAREYHDLSKKALPWLLFDKPYLEQKVIPSLRRHSHILDLGCGSGKVIETFINKGFSEEQIVGIDLSKELIALAKKTLPGAKFIVGDFTKYSFSPRTFNEIISVRSLEYLNIEELESVFRRAYQILKPDGRFIIITGHPLRVNDGDVSKYLERDQRHVTLPWGTKVQLFHKTISDFVRAGLTAGFTLQYIDEPDLPRGMKQKHPKEYAHYKSFGVAMLHLTFQKPRK